MKTPEEARDIQCCGPSDCGELRVEPVPTLTFSVSIRFCVADQCMAWRWGVENFDTATGKTLQLGTAIAADRLGERESGRGFCGLAGRP